MPTALVLGVNGQDGSYLAEHLLRRGYTVVGLGRQAQSRYVRDHARFHYHARDLEDVLALEQFFAGIDADIAFHVAAIHGSAGFQYEPVWREMMCVNVLALHALLEHARLRRPNLRIVYASSAKVFPAPLAGMIDEQTPKAATCLYSIGKIAAFELISQYRDRHRVAASNLFLFNHELPRRGSTYVLPMIVRCLAAARRDQNAPISLQTLDFRADWSSASELMDIAIDIAEEAPDRDFVLASGTTWHGRHAIDALFRRYGLDYRNHVREIAPQRDAGPQFTVSLTRLEAVIGRRPRLDFFAILDDMLTHAENSLGAVAAGLNGI